MAIEEQLRRIVREEIALARDRLAEDRWLSPEQAADYLGCGKQRVYNLRDSGRLPRDKEGGRAVNRRSDLDALVKTEAA